MADLDDFFAKKDRKKSKGKKFSTADEIAKKLEETGKKNEKLKKEKLPAPSNAQEVKEQGNIVKDEDEWKDFEEEKKDYTGLKIQNLTINDSDEAGDGLSGGEDNDGGLEENEAGEMVPKKKTGPWKVVADSTQSEPVTQQTAAAQPSAPQQTSGSYRPPYLRNQPLQPIRVKKTAAPDVKNEELFPSLSASTSHDSNKKKQVQQHHQSQQRDDYGGGSGGGGSGYGSSRRGEFEEVKNWRGSTPGKYEPPHKKMPHLALDNKYGALSES